MSWLDIVIVLAIGWFTFSAYNAGFIREIVILVATILAVVIAGLYYDNLAKDVLVFIENETSARVISFLVLLASVFLMGQLAATLLKKTAALLMLGWADHLAGAVFGFLKGMIIVEVLLILFVTYPELGLEDAIADSALAQVFLDSLPVLLAILPDEFERAVEDFVF
ncbi:MAG TPA: CvpA family protein [Dehalococcoidia bacterium]|nr:CvpA family protein [Dehalococcoidia bacterium]